MFVKEFYSDEHFLDIEIINSKLESIEFIDCEFTDCSFANTIFERCKFNHCRFHNCDLSLIRVDGCVLKGITFYKSKLVGINWSLASWGKKKISQLLKSVDFYSCNLNYSSFFGLELENINIEDCIAIEVDFSEGEFKNANMKGTDFTNSVFRNTNLENANFLKAKNYTISPSVNNLHNAKFAMPEALALLYSMDIEIINDPR